MDKTIELSSIFFGILFLIVCQFTISFISFPVKPLPSYYYPVQPTTTSLPSRYENDCWGVEDNFCWWGAYEI